MNRRSKHLRDPTKPVPIKTIQLSDQEKKAIKQEAAQRAKNWYFKKQLEKTKQKKKEKTVTFDNTMPSDTDPMIGTEESYMTNTNSHVIKEEPMTDRQALQISINKLIAEREKINETITVLRNTLNE